jgi:hypothetical protein
MAAYEDSVAEVMKKPWLYPGLPQRCADDLLLGFSHNHSLRVWSTWRIFRSDTQFFLRRIEWARGMDRVQLAGSTPSTFATESPIAKSQAESMIDSAHSLIRSAGPKPLSGFMIDGVYCSISLRQAGTSTTTSWISGQNDALVFDDWLVKAAELTSNLLPKSSAHLSYGNL